MSTSGETHEDLQAELGDFVDEVGLEQARDALQSLADAFDPIEGLEPGTVLGDFELHRPIGRGGMGVVFEAEQQSVKHRLDALKVLDSRGFGASRLRRFAREVEVIGRLDHPGIVPILSADLEGPMPHYAMKLLSGVSLRERIEGPDWDREDYRSIAEIMLGVARALQHAHGHGVIHRDVNPRNIMIEPDGRPVTVDFGLAHDDRSSLDLTHSADAIGTADYMAPEQITSRSGVVGPRTDVYALGVTLYQCLTGEVPYRDSSRHETFERILAGTPAPPRRLNRSIPADLQTICLHSMAARPGDRYAGAGSLADDLAAFLEFRPIAAANPSLLRLGRDWCRRHPLVVTSTAVLVLASTLSLAYFELWAPRRDADAQLVIVSSLEGDRVRNVARAEEVHTELRRLANLRQDLLPFESMPESDRMAAQVKLDGEQRKIEQRLGDIDLRIETALQHARGIASGYEPVRLAEAAFAARRLREELERLSAHFEPERVAAWEDRLREVDDGRWAAWLDRTGDLQVDCPQGGARVFLCPAFESADGRLLYREAEHAESIDLGETPVVATEVAEGSYLVRARRPGAVETRLPILLRRRTMQGERERKLEISVHTREEIGEGFVYVPGGFSVLGDQRELIWVDDFFIGERELTRRQFVAFHPESPLIDETGGINVAPGSPLPVNDRPLPYLQYEFFKVLVSLNRREAALEEPRFLYRLPHIREWERAGRGADGRRFPWGNGHDFAFSLNHWSGTDEDQVQLHPLPVPAEDRSPFGVHDLAGSLAEPCQSPDQITEIGIDRLYMRGGSFSSRTADELELARWRLGDPGTPGQWDTGLRLAKVSLPARPEGAPLPFGDDFERAHQPSILDGDWRAFFDSAQAIDALELGPAQRATLGSGMLRLRNYGDDFSPSLIAWHPIRAGEADLRLEAVVRISNRTSAGSRGVGLILFDRPAWLPFRSLALSWAADGCFRLGTAHSGWVSVDARFEDLTVESYPSPWRRLELEMMKDRAIGRVWALDGREPIAELELLFEEDSRSVVHAIGIRADNYQAVSVDVDHVRVSSTAASHR